MRRMRTSVMSSRITPIGVARREKATVLDPSLRRQKETQYAMHLLHEMRSSEAHSR